MTDNQQLRTGCPRLEEIQHIGGRDLHVQNVAALQFKASVSFAATFCMEMVHEKIRGCLKTG